jgi:hemerythrin
VDDTWATDLHLGHPEMDRDHRILAEIVDAFDRVCGDGCSLETVEDHLAKLLTATTRHFEGEERLMKSSGYPGIDEHVRAHDALVVQLRSLKTLVGQGLMRVGPTTIDFVRRWLAGHILTLDRAFVEFMTAPATPPSPLPPPAAEPEIVRQHRRAGHGAQDERPQ